MSERALIWQTIHRERAGLVTDLETIDDAAWSAHSLFGDWNVEEVVAHLIAGARETRLRWVRSVLRARFDFDLHNARRVRDNLGADPGQTLDRYRDVAERRTAPSGHHWAWLGEIVIHGEDIRRPLGLSSPTKPETAAIVAEQFARRDFTVPNRTSTQGLRLRATDSGFVTGDGPVVSGPTLSLLMAMAGRRSHLDDLGGDGVARLGATANRR